MPESQGHLRRSIGLVSGIVFVISAVIGTGVFKKVAPMSAELQSPGLVLAAWLLAGMISLAGTLSNAEVASMLVDSGGEYVYFRTIYNRFFAFLLGWTNFAVIRTASIASISYVFAQSLGSLITLPATSESLSSIHLFGLQPLDNLSVKLVAIGLVLILTLLNARGLKMGETISRILTVAMISTMLVIIVLGLFSATGSWANIEQPSVNFDADKMSGGTLASALALACLSAFWAYEGWNNLGYIGGEIRNPQRNLPWALTIGTLIIMTIYLLMNFVYFYVLPIDDIIAVHQSKNGIAAVVAVKHFLGNGGGLAISLLILVTTFNCTSSTILMASRLFYAMAKDGLFFKTANYIHPVFNTPSKALWIQGFWSSVLILSGTFDQLTDMLIFASFIFYGATTLGVFILRRKMPDVNRPYKVIGYPIVPGLFLVFCAFLVVNTLFTRTTEAMIGLLLMATGLPFYWIWRKRATV
ncbi:amino acid permease [Siphonobacter sp. BAB-5385]|uniref:APC family permease n=1 Tax=Siphonobacter sp. BAB-5385 TaxID=1864822 RepID=UPI000B9EC23B|nr:amino acid permease [Siphonobacter sp. BAB-5385]OZI07201.1 amino acid permease [Siphonobacter sp. BAB-5385]